MACSDVWVMVVKAFQPSFTTPDWPIIPNCM